MTPSDVRFPQDLRPLTDSVALVDDASALRRRAHDDGYLFFRSLLPVQPLLALRAEVLVLEKLFGEPACSGLGSICRVVSPGVPEVTTLPHQDRHYARAGVELWTVWIPLGDCAIAQGGLAVAAGSQRWGPQPHDLKRGHLQGVSLARDVAWHGADYACGDVVMFHGLTLHRACDNVTHDRLRISVDHRYQPLSGPRPAQ